MSTIPVIVEGGSEGKRGYLGATDRVRNIETGTLQKSMADLTEKISGILKDARQVGDFKLTQVELSVEISAEGGFSLVGTAKAGTKGAIKLTFAV